MNDVDEIPMNVLERIADAIYDAHYEDVDYVLMSKAAVKALRNAGYRIQKVRPVSPEMRVKLEAARDELKAGGPVGVMRYCHSCNTQTGRDADGVVWSHDRSCHRI